MTARRGARSAPPTESPPAPPRSPERTPPPLRVLRPPATPSDRPPPRSLFLLLLAALGPLAVLLVLEQLAVPLGCPGRFVYPYSPFSALRLVAALPALLLAALLAWAVLWAARPPRVAAGLALATLAAAGLTVWAYRAPPQHVSQHILNAHSPSHDGAFAVEAWSVTAVRPYLRDFPARAQTPPEQMRGTRVISNPPGATLLAVGVARLLTAAPGLRRAALAGIEDQILPPTHDSVALGLAYFWALTGLWAAAAPALYAIGRQFWPPTTALVFAVGAWAGPTPLLFTPGKDPAQLLTVAVPLLLWLIALRRRGPAAWTAAALASATAVLACVASLVHVWVALVVTVASAAATRGAARRHLARVTLAAVGGGVLTAVALAALADLNLPAVLASVARAQARVTRGPNAMPLAWQALGVPLFLLLAGTGFWTALLWAIGARDGGGLPPDCGGAEPSEPRSAVLVHARFGRWLVGLTTLVLVATVGFTNVETPRLWIPFLPLLLLGLLLQTSWVQAPGPQATRVLALLVLLHVATAALQWSRLDVREAEQRIAAQRYLF